MEERKKNHIDLAFESQTPEQGIDDRFDYEPLLSGHPSIAYPEITFLDKTFKLPFWVSSMTGGTALAKTINTNLAKACKEFGFGMGLGSCRILLEDNSRFDDFNMRPLIGDENALFANLGIAQIEQSVVNNQLQPIHDMVDRLQADGLIIHVNPIQEWVQPEGDLISQAPIDIIKKFIEKIPYKIIIKEVGQGMGKASLTELLKLPVDAIEFAAFGGTNFAKVELHRRNDSERYAFEPFSQVGVSAADMLQYVNDILKESGSVVCNQLIISGGIRTYLDGYYLLQKSKLPAIYGQASAFLRHAKISYESLHAFIESQINGLGMANAFLRIKP